MSFNGENAALCEAIWEGAEMESYEPEIKALVEMRLKSADLQKLAR